MLGDDDAVRRWFSAGMLDKVAAVLGLADIDEPWAHVLTARSPDTDSSAATLGAFKGRKITNGCFVATKLAEAQRA